MTMACTGMMILYPCYIPEVDGGAENDPLFPDDIRAEGQKYLVDNNIPHEIQIFPGVPHGQYPRVTEGSKLQLILE